MSSPAISAPPSLAPAPILQRDFPGWLPPMLVKELRQGLRARGFVGALILFQVVMLLMMLAALTAESARAGLPGRGMSAPSGIFWAMIGVQLLLVGPARALGGLQQEVDSRSIDLLMLTRLDAWRVVLGKWISLLVQSLLLLCAMLPYLVVRYFTDNADILLDLGICGGLFGLSAVVTAAGLWASGISKALRIVLVVLLVFSLQGIGGAFGVRFFGMRTGMAATGTSLGLIASPLAIFNATLIAAFFLVSAVRKIAPPAENRSFFARLLPLLAMVPSPFLEAFFSAHDLAVRQLFFGGGFLAFVLLFELGSPRSVMASHWRVWYRSGTLMRIVGRCALPGWQSALFYALVVGGLWTLFALIVIPTGSVASRGLAERAASLGLLALAGLVFPAVLLSFMSKVKAAPTLLYVSGLAIPLLLSGVAMALAESKWKITALKSVMETVPVSSFWWHAVNRPPQSTLIISVAGMVAVLTLGVALWQSRAYWRQLAAFEARDRVEPPPLPS